MVGRATSPPPQIRAEQAHDAPSVDRLVRDAFGGPAEAELVGSLRRSDAYLPDCTLVAEFDGAISGFVMATRGQVQGGGSTRIAIMAPVAVATDQQGLGIGQALVRALLHTVDRCGFDAVSVLGDPGYYGRFGFQPALPLGLQPPSPALATDAFQVRFRDEPVDLRGALRYPTPFGL